jgi:hypothetical protein
MQEIGSGYMARRNIEGICHICGISGKLSFEHVPPESAFNNRPVLLAHIKKLMAAEISMLEPRGKEEQRGSGAHTLCERCNNLTGKWYGGAYADFVCRGMEVLERTSGETRIHVPFQMFPLRVIKQVMCMILSANPPSTGGPLKALCKLVSNRDARYLPDSCRVYAF